MSDRLVQWGRSVIFRAPMEISGAITATAGGAVGVVTCYSLLLRSGDPPIIVLVWWVGIVASGLLLLRGLIGTFALARHARDLPFWWLGEHLPFTVRSPIVWKLKPELERSLGILDFELEMRDSTSRLLEALAKLYTEVGRGTEVLTRHAGKTGLSLDEMVKDARSFGDDYARHARRLETAESRVRGETARLVSSHLQRLDAYPPGADLSGVRELMETLRSTVTEAREVLADNVTGLQRLRDLNVHSAMNEAVDRARQVMTRIVEDYEHILGFTVEALAVIDQRMPRDGRP